LFSRFSRAHALPHVIAENIAYGLRLKGIRSKSELVDRIERRSSTPPLGRGAGQAERQRLMNFPAASSSGWSSPGPGRGTGILLFDEPTSALDPISTARSRSSS